MVELSGLFVEYGFTDFEDVVDLYENKQQDRKVIFSVDLVNKKLGANISADEIENILKQYNYTYIRTGENFEITPPSMRLDLNIPEDMLEEIGRVEHIPTYIKRAKDKNDSFRLMGFGHRVYKNYDPRAAVLRETCKEVLEELGQSKGNPMLEIAMELEKIALSDEYFIERKLYPNVDFYSGIIYRALGIPTDMFTVLFAIGRLPGWIAQWKEMVEAGEPIGRPRQVYTGPTKRDYVPIEKR